MATEPFNTYVTTLTSATAVAGADVVYINQSGLSRRATVGQIGSSVGGLPWINVKDAPYNATGNGATDDTAAINAAIAAFNSATSGVLYFPAGNYLVSSSLTTITAVGLIVGDGCGGASNNTISGAASRISFSSNSTPLFTITSAFAKLRDINLQCTAVSTPVTGSAGVLANGGVNLQTVNFDTVAIFGFYRNVDTRTGITWMMDNCLIINPVHFGLDIRNTVITDAGDWAISNTMFVNTGSTAAAYINQSGSGGGKIVNCKFNSACTTAILGDLSGTVDYQIANCSIENVTNGIILTNASGVSIVGIEFLGDVTNPITLTNSPGVVVAGCTGCSINCTDGTTSGSISTAGIQPAAGIFTGLTPHTEFALTEPSGSEWRMNWTGVFSRTTEFEVQSIDPGQIAVIRAKDSGGDNNIQLSSNAADAGGALSSDAVLKIISDHTVSSGGGDDVVMYAGGTTAEVLRLKATNGLVQFSAGTNFSANASVATVLGSFGPSGSRTTVQKWLTIFDGSGNPFYIPCF